MYTTRSKDLQTSIKKTSVSVREKKLLRTKNQKTGEEICDGPDTQLRPTLMSLKVNHYCQVVLTVLIKANAILKCLNDL